MYRNNPSEKSNVDERSLSNVDPDEEYDDRINYDKMKVECLCPKCGARHIMNLHWIGRGTPRKFCHQCKGLFS